MKLGRYKKTRINHIFRNAGLNLISFTMYRLSMASNPEVQFGEGGGFDFTPPSGFGIIPWVFSLLLIVFGLWGSIEGLIYNDWEVVGASGCFVVPGCLLGMWLTPTKLQKEFEKIRMEEKPRDFVHRSETGGSTGSF